MITSSQFVSIRVIRGHSFFRIPSVSAVKTASLVDRTICIGRPSEIEPLRQTFHAAFVVDTGDGALGRGDQFVVFP